MYDYQLKQRQVHLDFHTSEAIDGIGSKFSRENFRRCLEIGHVNSITLFAKCHHGWAYYPAKTNDMHPGLNFDLLSEQLSVCKEMGVSAPIYISAGYDENYVRKHPEDICRFKRDTPDLDIQTLEDGRTYIANRYSFSLICFNTPYLEP